jgi:hypothetical protein
MKTAVEWLIEQIGSSKYFYNLMEEIESKSTIVQPNAILQQAKAMEKEQIIDCYNEANTELLNEDGSFITGEQYYNETFKE